ncbi:MAG: lipoyl(octanoyl) transferase LipB [Rhodospirillaceae bacterium]|jgi:lipoyl(octanoyl) transferase|nr:lipoyl(octanoyl) transferase LipB [Rhodospirillaceae bacterium]
MDTILQDSELEWQTSAELIDYETAHAAMEARVAGIHDGSQAELLWFLEHPPLYTAGTSARAEDLLDAARFPVHKVGRGGQYTYHGPGQRVVYTMLDLKKRGGDVRQFVRDLESWVIDSLAQFGVTGERREGRVGIWVELDNGQEKKIAAIGIRVRHWITFHGIAINVNPELEHFSGIVPCGIAEHGVTSLHDLGIECTMNDVDAVLKTAFIHKFIESN